VSWSGVSPSKVRGDSGSCRRVTAAKGASHEVWTLFRVLSASTYPALWVSQIPPCRFCFQTDFAVFVSTPAPGHLRFRVHPLVSLPPSSESYPLEPAPRLRAVRLPWGSSLLRDINPVSPLPGRHPSPASVPPSAFLTLSTVCSSPNLAGLFHPAAASEVHSSGASPDDQPCWLITSRCPRAVTGVRLHRASSLRQRAPSDFRALLRSPVRCRRRAV
jgi:hypothetical protein